ncbi:glutathione peroxidase [Kiritimatiellota bacterium B12222]|nr:glutathione peroxidase [Kiritimatiellota bacterium B12222]
MKSTLLTIALFFCLCSLHAAEKSVHDFKVVTIDGEAVNLAEYKGKVLLIVNTASKCGFTKQYADLVTLQKDYADKGVVVLGFPANNFGKQEPGSNAAIAEFCSATYGVDFPMFAKVSVKGADQDPLFTYLTQVENPDFTGDIRWNFEKFLVDQDGHLTRRFRSKANPSDTEIRGAIDVLLVEQN